jgi:hypothetical protein
METDLVNIIYVEPGGKAPSTVKDMLQQNAFVVLPKNIAAPSQAENNAASNSH